MTCKPLLGIVAVDNAADLPIDGSALMAFVEPAGGVRLHGPMGLLSDRCLAIFVGGAAQGSYYDETIADHVNLPNGWVCVDLPA